MSLSLTLAFERYAAGLPGPILCAERHRLDWQNYDAFTLIKSEAIPLTCGVDWYDDDGIETRHTDPYGNSLTFMTAHTITRHLAWAILPTAYDKAVLAFVSALPPETRVVLWWC